MRLLKRKVLFEDDNPEMIEQDAETEFVEPTPDDLLAQVANGSLSIDDITSMYNNGEISEETMNATLQQLDQMAKEETPEGEDVQTQQLTAEDLISSIDSGNMTPEDVDAMHANGEISDEVYNDFINIMNQATSENPEEVMTDEEAALPEEPELEPQAIQNPFNLVHLFEHFRSLKKYINIYIDSFSDIDLDQITDLQYKTVSNIFKDIKDTSENLDFYITNNFDINDYNKNLYIYLLYNKRFSENILKLRRVLQLSKEVLVDEEKIKREDEKKRKAKK